MLGDTRLICKGSATGRENSNKKAENIGKDQTLGETAVCLSKLGRRSNRHKKCERKSQRDFAKRPFAPNRDLQQLHRGQKLQKPPRHFRLSWTVIILVSTRA